MGPVETYLQIRESRWRQNQSNIFQNVMVHVTDLQFKIRIK